MLKNKLISHTELSKIATENVNLPNNNEFVFFINNAPNPILKHIIEIALKENVQEIKCCFYRISKKQLEVFRLLQKKQKLPDKIDLVLSDSIKSMVKGTFEYLKDSKNFNTSYINTHAKYALLKTTNNSYIILSSGNSNPDGKIEQTLVLNNNDAYNEMMSFVSDCMTGKIKT